MVVGDSKRNKVSRRGFLGMLGAGAVCLGLPGCASGRGRRGGGKRPNFVFFLVDDMGWTDAGCFGSSFMRLLMSIGFVLPG